MLLIQFFKFCFSTLGIRERRDFFLVLALGIISAAFELVGLASIIPVIAFIVGGEEAKLVSFVLPLTTFFPSTDPAFILGVLSVIAISLGVLVNLLYIFARNRFAQRLAATVTARVFTNYLDDDVDDFYARSEGEMLRNVGEVGDRVANGVIQNGLQIATRITLLVLILAILLNVNLSLTLLITLVLAVVYLSIHLGVRRYVESAARRNFTSFRTLHQVKLGAYAAYRKIVMDGLADRVVSGFSRIRKEAGRRSANIAILSEVPRHILEATGIILLLLGALFLSGSQASEMLMPNMAIFALAAFRILPALQQIYHGVNQMASVMGVERTIRSALRPREMRAKYADLPVPAFRQIRIERLAFAYARGDAQIFSDFELQLVLEGVILVKGPSGSGKSTMFDLLMGFRQPDSGAILVDGQSLARVLPAWRRACTYIPQEFGFFGDDLQESITFSDSGNYDSARYARAMKVSGLSRVMQRRGIDDRCPLTELMFSGGEKNRHALAGALYSDAHVVFMDEPFSGLDLETARAVAVDMVASYPDKCFIVITHRESEFAGVENKRVVDITYS